MKKKSKYEILEEIQENLKDENGVDPLEGRVFNGYELTPEQKKKSTVISIIIGLLILGIPILLILGIVSDLIKIF